MKKFLLGAALSILPGAALAQSPVAGRSPVTIAPAQNSDADPALWVVRDEDTTIYLFGTFHMLDGKRDWFNDEVRTAFDSSKELVLEAKLPDDPSGFQPLIAKFAVDPSGRTLTSKLSAANAKKLAAALASFGAPATAFDPFEPWFASMTVVALKAQSIGLNPEHGPEKILTAAARKSGKPIGELEGLEFQFQLFDEMPEAQQLKLLTDTLDTLADTNAMLGSMLTAWSAGDVDKLVELMNDPSMADKGLYELMFTKRNATWADWIDARLDSPGTVFIAVGAGHLAGQDNVRSLLEKRGIASARVE
jgi:hypothetical protein